MREWKFRRYVCAMACVLLIGAAGAEVTVKPPVIDSAPVNSPSGPQGQPANEAATANHQTGAANAAETANNQAGISNEAGTGSETRVAEDAAGPRNLRFNFRDVPLDTVLDYLSEAAGFTVVREATVDGHVDIVSLQPLNKDEAVALLNTVLNGRGYAAIRNERTLTIVKSEDAKQKDIPVHSGAIPEAIPKTGEMITQVIPVRHADATQLLENLKPLLPSYAVANANESSNAIVLTDTQADVRRMAEIIKALDTSISAISEVRVFPLNYANAGDVATMINSLFQLPATQGQPAAKGGPVKKGKPVPGPNNPESAARLAASRVQAVGDDRTNSVVVSAPGDTMPLIETILEQIDIAGVPMADYRVFQLKFADAGEMAQILNDAFGPNAAVSSPSGARTPQTGGKPTGAKSGGGNHPNTPVTLAHAVPDFRTNSVVVTAESEVMERVASMVEKLESNPARDQKVFIYKLKNADVEQVANVLLGMFPQSASTVNRPRTTTSSSTQNRGISNRSSSGSSSSMFPR